MPMYLFRSITVCNNALQPYVLHRIQCQLMLLFSLYKFLIITRVHFSIVKVVMLVHNIWTSLYFCLVLIYDSGQPNTEHKQIKHHESYVLAENLFSESFHTS